MNRHRCARAASTGVLLLVFTVGAFAQAGFGAYIAAPSGVSSSLFSSTEPEPAESFQPLISVRLVRAQSAQQVDLYREPVRPFSKIAVGIEGGTLGIGVALATPITRTLNLRAGADFLNFGYGLVVDAAHYGAEAHLRSGHISVDYHPFGGGFRISPGALLFQSGFSASVYIPGAQAFELGDVAYISSATDPVHGGASIKIERTVMPALTVGWGNMLGERKRHWSIPFEIGAAYTGHYTLNLNLAGTACLNGLNCMSTTTTEVQNSIHEEEAELNEVMKHFQVYPIVSIGAAYRF